MGHTLEKGASKLEKCVRLGKMGHTWKLGTFENVGHTSKNGSHLEKWFPLERIGNTWKYESHLKRWVALKTCGKAGHTWKNGSHLGKRVTLGKKIYT